MRYFYFIFLFFISAIFANPTDPIVVNGEATFVTEGNQLTITASDKTIIDWADFSIETGELTNIIQSDTLSTVLCRVPFGDPSTILGTITSNGGLILINPNGIYVHTSGNISVNCYFGSTLDVPNTEFLAGGDMTFSGSSVADIENQGLIQSNQGPIFLLGRHLINTNNLISLSSKVALGAGSSILFKSAENNISINPDSPNKSGVGIDNSGSILSNQADLKADGNLYSLAIHQTGSINAVVSNDGDGEIYLIADKGETRLSEQSSLVAAANQGVGGTIYILGEDVALLDQTEITTSNEHGGGPIFIGGGFQGNNPAILNATNTTIGPDVSISSAAGIQGNAGDIVIWGNNTTDYKGTINATGGSTFGNGALVEISGLINLIYEGTVDTEARNGQDGTLLLDPENMNISSDDLTRALLKNNIIIMSNNEIIFFHKRTT